ncbi:hypothetical protein P7C70_g496, partial [Phenoliferia sp. Uapishka_3]
MKALESNVVSTPTSFLPPLAINSLTSVLYYQSIAIFDTSYLIIKAVSLLSTDSSPVDCPLEYTLEARHPVLGQKLSISLLKPLQKDDKVKIKIEYETTKDCTAVGWLEPQQTKSGKFPFCYSQCQAIHCRSLLPDRKARVAVQDTPSVKITYEATVASNLPILMYFTLRGSSSPKTKVADMFNLQRSALRTSPAPDSPLTDITDTTTITYVFSQPIAIPSYLIAISGGEVAFKSLGTRTGVWSEPGVLDAAVWEFKKDTEKYLATAESLTCDYVWGRYDVLVLPASFPYGGMENSNLTFLTPALITGDRSETDTIAHEIAHSWFGNLVGVANWWTTYTERLIARELRGEPARSFEYIVGNKGLKDELAKHADHPAYQRLHIPYSFGEDPDEAYGSIAYDKGAQFLLHLERTVGGLEPWIPYMKKYVETFRGQSITTNDWLEHFHEYWAQFPEKALALKGVDFDAWLNGEGLNLPVKMEFDTSLADAAYGLAAKWDAERDSTTFPFSAADIEDFSSNQVAMLLDTLVGYPTFSSGAIKALNQAYDLDAAGNPEIRLRWYAVALKAGQFAKEAASWVETTGRMKFCRPTYKALNRVDPALARKTFLESGVTFLHPIAKRMIAQDLGIEL